MRVSIAPAIALALLVSAIFLGTTRTASAVEYGTVTLAWTAPGDDSLVGTASAYDLRYFTIPISPGNFFSATPVTPGPTPLSSGKAQSTTVHGLTPGTWYYFAIRSVDDVGNWSGISNIVRLRASYPLAVGDAPIEVSFSSPFPNPARGVASFTLGLPTPAAVDVEAFDVSGRHVRTLMNSAQQPGRSTLVWDLRDEQGRALSNGLYLVRARVGDQTFIRRVSVDH